MIVGGGPGGMAAALALAARGLSVCLADALGELAPLPASGFDLRVVALNRSSQQFLTHLGVWPHLDKTRIAAFEAMRVWDAQGFGEIVFDAGTLATSCLGHIVETANLMHALEQVRAAHDNLTVMRGVRVTSIHCQSDGVLARLSDGGRISGQVLIGADGGRSVVREYCRIEAWTRSYEQVAVVANLRMSDGHANTAWQRFMPSGPLAVLPLPGDYASIVWTTTPQSAGELLALGSDEFAQAVGEAFAWRRGEVVWSGSRGSFPLFRVRARHYVATRVALMGDAAHTVHPLAGQGLNLALMDAAALADVLGEVFASGGDIGTRTALRRYERWRKTHNLATQYTMDGLRWLFGNSSTPLRILRNLGLSAASRAGPFKTALARLACGLSGDLPPAARPPLDS
ncbi:MAG: hypothetical protein GKR94_32995 [Gammaproteobacteria bacterium]|nr:hypothetical protein [Gammaproteobacteria bacterium]